MNMTNSKKCFFKKKFFSFFQNIKILFLHLSGIKYYVTLKTKNVLFYPLPEGKGEPFFIFLPTFQT
ncbi:MAG: hypothetical protein RLZZ292_972 [Bacteroidota bacterium]|jgi:hypothetical protein